MEEKTRQLTITGEQLSANHVAAEEYICEFTGLVASRNYSPEEVYNADETGLNFKALPKKSLASKDESRAPGFKVSKERATLLACSNAAGTNKFPLKVIGKSAKPCHLQRLPTHLKLPYATSRSTPPQRQLM